MKSCMCIRVLTLYTPTNNRIVSIKSTTMLIKMIMPMTANKISI